METTISVERLYFLGNFKNIKISNTLAEIPEDFMSDKVLDLLYKHQLISVEKAYRQYHEIIKDLPADAAEAIEFLDAERVATMEELKQEFERLYTASKKPLEASQT